MAVWPAGQVLAQAACAYGLKARKENRELTALELGCGCGLASLALLSLGVKVIATDFRRGKDKNNDNSNDFEDISAKTWI